MHTIKSVTFLFALLAFILPLSACSSVKENLGLEKDSPDEFAVITRAPLEIPSKLALPPPNLGAPRPQEVTTIKQAKEAVFGEHKTAENSSSQAESVLLEKAGGTQAEPNIRATVNNETAEMKDRNKAVADKLLNLTSSDEKSSATIVDSKKELERIQQNKQEGKSITEGETPYIED